MIKSFDPHTDPETVGPRWTRWLQSFTYFAETKWLLVNGAPDAEQVRTQRRSALLHYAGASSVRNLLNPRWFGQHNQRLKATLMRFRERGLTLNGEKCSFRMSRITFFGHDLTDEGVLLHEEKIAAALNVKELKNKSELLSFLCLIQYSSKFLPDFTQTAQPLW